ncbi:MAG: hypothetical protein H0U65_03575 [Rubrobacter sp.]|nr:hypothetical protein [Rubrobacter sp.]
MPFRFVSGEVFGGWFLVGASRGGEVFRLADLAVGSFRFQSSMAGVEVGEGVFGARSKRIELAFVAAAESAVKFEPLECPSGGNGRLPG